jgi:hypothetical protein
MNVNVWFSKKIRFIGEHGDIGVEVYDYAILQDGTRDKNRLVCRETYYCANLKQAIKRALECTAPDDELMDWETVIKVIELRNRMLENFTNAFYKEYKSRCKGIGMVLDPVDRNITVVMSNRSEAIVELSGKKLSDSTEHEDTVVKDGIDSNVKPAPKKKPVAGKPAQAEVKSIRKGK